jgi:hypothetical protein
MRLPSAKGTLYVGEDPSQTSLRLFFGNGRLSLEAETSMDEANLKRLRDYIVSKLNDEIRRLS